MGPLARSRAVRAVAQQHPVAPYFNGWDDDHDLSVESLPYTVLLLLAQFTAGSIALVLYTQIRGTFEAAFIRTCTYIVVSSALLLTLTALFINPTDTAEAYILDSGAMQPIRALSLALLLFSVVYMFYVRRTEERFLSQAFGATSVGIGAVLLVFCADLVRIPTWNIAGPILTLFAGALTLGSFSIAMVWGHWYLVNPKLEAGPLNELTLISFGAILLQLGITALNAIIPAGMDLDSNALLAIDLAANPAFWLRIGIGLVFPAALAYMAYSSSRENSMMSATGLLYIAVGAILAGEALGRGLLFVTGSAV
jgi:hypothetical protein